MKGMMEYKGYFGSVHYSEENLILYGKVEYINALVSYEGDGAEEIRTAFYEAIDDYIAFCEEQNITPETPFKGSYNVRLGAELHRKVAIAAKENDMSINNFTKEALEAASNNPDFLHPDEKKSLDDKEEDDDFMQKSL